MDSCATTTTKTKVVKLRAEPKSLGIRALNLSVRLRSRCPLTDKLRILPEPRHARRIRSYYLQYLDTVDDEMDADFAHLA